MALQLLASAQSEMVMLTAGDEFASPGSAHLWISHHSPHSGWVGKTDIGMLEMEREQRQLSHMSLHGEGPPKEVCGNEGQEHHPLLLTLQWKNFKGERKKKEKPGEQSSLISCHQQRGALCLRPAAAVQRTSSARSTGKKRSQHRCRTQGITPR